MLTAERAVAPRRGLSRPRVGGVGRVWLFSVAMMVAALGLYLAFVADLDAVGAPFSVPWWALAVLFILTETNVVRVRYRTQAQSIPLNEFPLVIGLFFSNPTELLIGLLLGSSIALARRRRQSPLQLAFNTSHFFLAAVLAITAFQEVAVVDILGPVGWSGAILSCVIVTLLGHAAITLATLLAGRQPHADRLRQVLSLGLTSTITVTAVSLVVVGMLWRDQRSAFLLSIPAAIGYLVYRGYMEDRSRTETLDVIYESTRLLQRSPEVDAAIMALLTQAKGMFRAERAEITMFPGAEDFGQAVRTSLGPGSHAEAMAAVTLDPREREWAAGLPLREGVLYPDDRSGIVQPLADRGLREAMVVAIRREEEVAGVILVGNRVGESGHFDRSDLEVFEPLARNLGTVLESRTLEQSLQQLRDLEAQLRHRAYHDPLTSLSNRTQFVERVELALEFSDGDPSRMAVLLVDVDDFKVVNDTLGLPAGDQVLVAIATRIKQVIGPEDAAARLGADEFAVLLDCSEPDVASDVAEALLEAIRRPFLVNGQEVEVRASIGIATGDTGRWADALLRNADVAMYAAKAAGKNRAQAFSPNMHVAAIERHELMTDLQRAVERDEFVMHYQPIVELASGRIVALEALVRWHHPTRGVVGPVDFIPMAEESGLILPIGRLILQKACQQARDWQQRLPEYRELAMAVNISARQLQQVSFVGETVQLIAESGVPAGTLILEITETVLMEDTERHVEKLKQLKSLGLRLAMDDFGTGYSSLSFLNQLPVDILKIAKPFVEGLGRSTKDEAFAQAIVRLGQTVGMALIAEGVERPDQLEELRRLGCDMVQGHHFSIAGDAVATEELLRRGIDPGGGGGKVIPFPA